MNTEYIVVTAHIIGNPTDGYRTAYNSDLRSFAKKQDCIKHGLQEQGSDDFNIGVVTGGYLTELWWMDKQKPLEDAIEAAEGLDLASIEPQSCPIETAARFPIRAEPFKPERTVWLPEGCEPNSVEPLKEQG